MLRGLPDRPAPSAPCGEEAARGLWAQPRRHRSGGRHPGSSLPPRAQGRPHGGLRLVQGGQRTASPTLPQSPHTNALSVHEEAAGYATETPVAELWEPPQTMTAGCGTPVSWPVCCGSAVERSTSRAARKSRLGPDPRPPTPSHGPSGLQLRSPTLPGSPCHLSRFHFSGRAASCALVTRQCRSCLSLGPRFGSTSALLTGPPGPGQSLAWGGHPPPWWASPALLLWMKCHPWGF